MKRTISFGLLALVFTLAGCRGGFVGGGPEKAEAQLKPTAGNTVNGVVSFSSAGQKIRVVAEVRGLTPGAHGFHIHEKGDCSAPDGSSAGGHYNPQGKHHGHPDNEQHHAGDMPQLIADSSGLARMTAYLSDLEMKALPGLSVIVHASPDDFKTQPTGNSGARQACGVITLR